MSIALSGKTVVDDGRYRAPFCPHPSINTPISMRVAVFMVMEWGKDDFKIFNGLTKVAIQ